MEELKFDRIKWYDQLKVSKEFVQDMRVGIGREHEDYLMDTFTIRFESVTMERLIGTKVVTHVVPKPKFLDWLFGRRKVIHIEVKAKEVLIHPETIGRGRGIVMYDSKVLNSDKPFDL